MANSSYDIITVGGGLGGAALAKVMAAHGARVLVLERETQFKDRVRGEWIAPWGVVEAQQLRIYDLLRNSCGHELPGWANYQGPELLEPRNLIATTPQGVPALVFYHPTMQEVVSQAASDAGAEVRRGATVRDVKLGQVPTVTVEQDGRVEEIQARLIVGVDGRASMVRKWGGFETQRDPEQNLIAGVFFDEMPALPTDSTYCVFNPRLGQIALLIPQDKGRVRAYFVYPTATKFRLQGTPGIPRFIAESVQAGAPSKFFVGAQSAGFLATFAGADLWVNHPYNEGVVLIGDAAASSDPTWGQGLSLTLRDVRVLRDQLLRHEDWNLAGHSYAAEHDRYYSVIHTSNNWLTTLFLETGPEAEARRTRVLPLIAQDATRKLDHQFSGPELPTDESVRRRFFGEDQRDA